MAGFEWLRQRGLMARREDRVPLNSNIPREVWNEFDDIAIFWKRGFKVSRQDLVTQAIINFNEMFRLSAIAPPKDSE